MAVCPTAARSRAKRVWTGLATHPRWRTTRIFPSTAPLDFRRRSIQPDLRRPTRLLGLLTGCCHRGDPASKPRGAMASFQPPQDRVRCEHGVYFRNSDSLRKYLEPYVMPDELNSDQDNSRIVAIGRPGCPSERCADEDLAPIGCKQQ